MAPTGTKALSVTSIADRVGVVASTACALHCVLVPALLITGTTLPIPFLADEGFHRAMLWLILPAALLAFGMGCWRHKDTRVMVLGAVGLVGIVLAGTVLHDLIGETGERVVTLVSAAILIGAHVRNFRLCRSDRCEHDAD
ncbi:MAG: MerC domain-containing protein [Pseudomonadota bacterium]